MAYKAYITALTNVRPHSNADRLLLGDCFGNTVCVSLEYAEGQVGVYFPSDGQLSVEFCEKNNLVRKKDENGVNIGGYLDPDKRNVTAIKLRGEKSDGLFLPLSALDYCFAHGDASTELFVGDVIEGTVNGHEICCKYIPRTNRRSTSVGTGNKTRKRKVPTAPLFVEHADTEQLAYNLAAFKPGDQIEITLKMHGTSQRTGYLPVLQGYADSWPCRVGNAIKAIINKLAKKEIYEMAHDGEPVYDYGYVTGTRRTVLNGYEGGFYGSNEFREQHAKKFEGKLWKNESIYYEVVGFTNTGAPIMGNGNNEKLGKDFVKQYGKETVFSYGCSPTGVQSDIYVYRMTMTNPDGDVIEYTPDFMRYRCEQMGVKYVPLFFKGFIPEDKISSNGECEAGNYVKELSELCYDGPDPIGKTHVREGVVVRIVNRPKFAAYKHKCWSFKCLEGLVKAEAESPDMEEAEEVNDN